MPTRRNECPYKLQVGDFVQLKNGKICIVLSHGYSTNGLALYSSNSYNSCYELLSKYDENLKHICYPNCKYDIMKVFKASQPKENVSISALMHIFYCTEEGYGKEFNVEWDWEREEVKEMTMADIEKLVGCKVKIVK